MSTPTRPNGYVLADTNSLVYAYRAGGTKLLDTYFDFAARQGRELAITSTVANEIKKGPLGQELGRYIADKDIKVLPTPKLERQLETGQVSSKNAGEASMLKVAAEEHPYGRSTRIWSDDKFFENPQAMRGAQGAEPVKTSQLLDQMRESQFITDAEYRRTQARYQAAVPEFKPASASHSQRLATFDGPAPRVLDHLGVADASIAAKPGFQNFAKATGLGGGALMGYDAAATHTQYNALTAQGNQFGADALLHEYVGRTGGGLAAGFAAGAAYGVATGSWSGPGALVTGAVGGTIGAFGGEAIGRAYTKYQMNHQVGDDGNTYVHTHGHWEQSNWVHKNQPAAPDQIDTLEYKRTSAITELALARPQHLDPQNITLQDPRGHRSDYRLTKDGWVTEVTDQGPYGTAIPVGDFGAVLTHDERAAPDLSKQLDQISAVRRDANAHYSENLAKAYMTDYVGRGFARDDRPVPESVTQLLRLPSEIHVKDPATGQTWERSPQGAFTRTDYVEMSGLEGKDYIPRTLTAKGEELARLDKEHQGLVQTNRQYGAALVEQKFQEMQQQQLKHQQPPQQTAPHGQQQPASGHMTPQQIERITTHESRIVPTLGGMSFAEAHKRRDEPEQISPGSLQPVGKLDSSHHAKSSPLQRPERIDEPGHPGHDMFKQARRALVELNADHGVVLSEERTDTLAAGLAASAALEGMTRIDHVHLGTDSSKIFAAQGKPGSVFSKVAGGEVMSFMDAPLAQSSQTFVENQQSSNAKRWISGSNSNGSKNWRKRRSKAKARARARQEHGPRIGPGACLVPSP